MLMRTLTSKLKLRLRLRFRLSVAWTKAWEASRETVPVSREWTLVGAQSSFREVVEGE
jgi:hypothetical protein